MDTPMTTAAPLDRIGLGYGGDDALRQRGQCRLILMTGQQYLEFVAALTPDQPGVADHALQPLTDLPATGRHPPDGPACR